MTPELVNELFQIVLLPLLGALTAFAVKWIKAKTNEVSSKTDNEILKKYIEMLSTTVTSCVIATNQTYVDTLKAQGNFDAEAQKKAFEKTYDAVMAILSEEAKDYLSNSLGDLQTYIVKLIESNVKAEKK